MPATNHSQNPADAPLCPKCHEKRVWTRIGSNITLSSYEQPIESTDCEGLVCLTCGYTELYAKDPATLRTGKGHRF